jgi:tetratricopeptide (TPR) repeat protein
MSSFATRKRAPIFSNESDPECDRINESIRGSKYDALYQIMNAAVVSQFGPSFHLNWRWLDLNLLLSELKLFEFGKIEWYDDIDVATEDPKRDLARITNLFRSKPPIEQVQLLFKSIIELEDNYLAKNAQNSAVDCESRGKLREAIEAYQSAISLDPHCVQALYNYADLMVKVKMIHVAGPVLKKLVLLDSANARAWGLYALIKDREGKLNEAVEYYEKAYALDKSSSVRMRNYAMTLVTAKNYPRAKTLFEEAIALDQRNGIMIGEYADLLHTMELYTESMAAFERALATKNINGTVLNDYAALLHKAAIETGDEQMMQRAKDMMASIHAEEFTSTSSSSTAVHQVLANKSFLAQSNTNCANCGIEGKSACGKCHRVRYCSKECQKAHWSTHKKSCKKY